MRLTCTALALLLILGACKGEAGGIASSNVTGDLAESGAAQLNGAAAEAPTAVATVTNGNATAEASENTKSNEAGAAASNEASKASPESREHPRIARLREHCARRRNDPGVLEPDADELPENLQGHTWRCRNGVVMVCSLGASGRRCMSEMSVDAERMAAFREFCRDNPGAYIPGALTTGLHSEWTCRGTSPMQTSAGSADRDGYQRGAWRPI